MNVLPRYRAEIDGLRAVAVLAVVGYHAFPEHVHGGFAGVDVFFVISGFLISSIIFESLREGRFSYLEFYSRRIKRIFPALLAVLAATALLGQLVALPDEARRTGTEMFAGAAFLSNVLFLRQGESYFDVAAELKPLLHLWSLGIEEQFYIVWPLLAALLFRRPRLLLPATLALLAASFALWMAWSHDRPNVAFYSLPSRFWELLVGAVIAYRAIFMPPWRPSRLLAEVAAVAGLGMIGLAVMVLSAADAFPGWRALLPTAGTALLILAGSDATVNRALLSARPLVAIGLVSYPLYLWHWPLLAMAKIHYGSVSSGLRVAVVLASLLLAWLTFKHVESPIRFGTTARVRPLGLVGLMCALAAVGLLMRADLLPGGGGERAAFVRHFENTPPGYQYARHHDISRLYRLDCDFYDFLEAKPRDSIDASCFTPGQSSRILIWGDSHAQSLSHGLRTALPRDVAVLQVATSACSPSITETSPDRFGVCNRSNYFALRTIQRVRPDVVVIAQAEGHLGTDWRALARAIQAAGAKEVMLVGPLPQWRTDLHKIIARQFWDAPPRRVLSHLDRATLEADASLRKRYAGKEGPVFVSIIQRLCDAEGCLAYVDSSMADGLITFDYGHLTRLGSELVGREILAPAIIGLLSQGEKK